MKLIDEFKKFAFKGNLVDMAVGFIIGGAFGTVVKSLVDDVVMPLVGLMTNGIDFSDRFSILKRAEGVGPEVEYATAALAKEAGNTVMAWGGFVTSLISFLIVAFVLFLVVKKFLIALQKEKQEDAPAAPPEPGAEEKLLTEIRDLLKAKN